MIFCLVYYDRTKITSPAFHRVYKEGIQAVGQNVHSGLRRGARYPAKAKRWLYKW